jgi:isopenicillin-N N-acyltransferase-like protein
MKRLKKILKRLLITFLVLSFLLACFGVYVYSVRDIEPPKVNNRTCDTWSRIQQDSLSYSLNQSWIQCNTYGLYEMYLEGKPYEMGTTYGKLASELLYAQEKAFTNEIKRMVPSASYLKFLRYIVGFMNRNLSDYVIDEYQQEIYGISQSASNEFDWIGTHYSRQLNYHAAHDIGHALANMMLVGCTSFATWNTMSADSQLIVGRNFDFYVGDEFAQKKIIAFYKPEKGIPFVSIIWGGFTGVVSGMNREGLTVTINANKSSIPFGAATPVSLVAREILQYASTIEQAVAIARKRKMFVSESFLVSSAKDNKAVVIEKTPDNLDVYDAQNDRILCTNHYQSQQLSLQKLNQEQMSQSASVYRYERLVELLNANGKMTPQLAASILRDYRGKANADIGLTNEKALNQFIAHHSIIFEPKKQLVWISTSPWQMGTYLCYDLNRIFEEPKPKSILYSPELSILPDSFLYTATYSKLTRYLQLEQLHLRHQAINPAEIVTVNPTYYDAYRIAGDVYIERNQKDSAHLMYQQALSLEIATEIERKQIQEKAAAIK